MTDASPAGLGRWKNSGPLTSSPVVRSQFCAKPVCSGIAPGPSIRICMSRQCSGSCAQPRQWSAMPAPPVKARQPSMISDLRWVR